MRCTMPLAQSHRPLYYGRPCLPACRPRSRLGVLQIVAARPPNRSFDSEDDLDSRGAEEFASVSNPARFQKLAQHLDLMWRMSEGRRPEQCDSCRGSGEYECSWCHGTGVMTIGDTIYCNHEGCKSCPVCRGMGQCKCERCRGTGRRAGWLDPGQKNNGYANM